MKDVIVIKIGGVAAQKLSDKFIKQMQEWIAAGKKIVVVHGGWSGHKSTHERAPAAYSQG